MVAPFLLELTSPFLVTERWVKTEICLPKCAGGIQWLHPISRFERPSLPIARLERRSVATGKRHSNQDGAQMNDRLRNFELSITGSEPENL